MQLGKISEILQDKFNKNITSKNLLPEEVKLIVVGLSGGVDSVCLLDLLSNYLNTSNREIKVILHHQDHMIREDSYKDLQLARELAISYGFAFESSTDNIPEISKANSQNMEELGRDVRRENWFRICRNNSSFKNLRDCRILTAHHANDQAETLLLNLSRGAGLGGLSGIAYTDELFVRPLLNFTKEEIYNYARENKLSWREDYTNALSDNRRNYLRNIMIPQWEEASDYGLVMRLSNAADKLAIANQFIIDECNKWIDYILIKDASDFVSAEYNLYSVKKFREASVNLRKFLIHEILKYNGLEKDIYEINLQDIETLLLQDRGEKELSLSSDFTLVKNRKFFYLFKDQELYNQPNSKDNNALKVSRDLTCHADFYSNSEIDIDDFEIRTFNSGDFIINEGKKVLLKDFFSQENIRLDLRKNIFLIAKDSRVYVIGRKVIDNFDNPFYCDENTNNRGERTFKKSYYWQYLWYNSNPK